MMLVGLGPTKGGLFVMPHAALLEQYRTLSSSTWSDALDELRLPGLVRGLTQRSGGGGFAGFALTATVATGPLGTYERSEFAVGKLIDRLEPGHVLALAAGGTEVSCFGGLAAFATKRQGAAAVLIDGGC